MKMNNMVPVLTKRLLISIILILSLTSSLVNAAPITGKTFKDVPANHWAAASIQQAAASGFMSGYPGNLF